LSRVIAPRRVPQWIADSGFSPLTQHRPATCGSLVDASGAAVSIPGHVVGEYVVSRYAAVKAIDGDLPPTATADRCARPDRVRHENRTEWSL